MRSILERLESRKKIAGDCWRYSGYHSLDGYGQTSYRGKKEYVHRLSMHIYKNFNLESDLQINHKPECKYRDCWNPEHLYVGTQVENMSDMSESITHCPQGHEYIGDNIVMDNGYRKCRICLNSRARTRYHRGRT